MKLRPFWNIPCTSTTRLAAALDVGNGRPEEPSREKGREDDFVRGFGEGIFRRVYFSFSEGYRSRHSGANGVLPLARIKHSMGAS